MELTHITTLSGESIWVNKDKILTVQTDWMTLGVGEEPRNVTAICLEDSRIIYTEENEYDLAWRLNKSEIEMAVDGLLAKDGNGRVVKPT